MFSLVLAGKVQCFDFRNYFEINSRRPSWCCPNCNQHVCYTDIHVDQNMVKVLREVRENVADVIISADGSWKAIFESYDNTDLEHDNIISCKKKKKGIGAARVCCIKNSILFFYILQMMIMIWME